MTYRPRYRLLCLALTVLWSASHSCGGKDSETTISGTTSRSSVSQAPTQKIYDFTDAKEYTADSNITIANSAALLNPTDSGTGFNVGSHKNTTVLSNSAHLSIADPSFAYKLPDANSTSGWFNMSAAVFLYHLDESPATSNTTVKDSTSTPYDGQLKSTGANVARDENFRFGKVITFNGTGDHVDLSAAIPALSSVSGDHSLSVWFKDDTSGSSPASLIALSDGSDSSAPFKKAHVVTGDSSAASDSESICFVFEDDSAPIDVQACVETPGGHRGLRDGKWHHLVLIEDTGTVSLYLDGIARTLSAPDRGSVGGSHFLDIATPTALYLGARAENGANVEPFKGSMAEVSLFAEVLTTADVLQLYSRQAPFFRGSYHTPAGGASAANKGWLDMAENRLNYNFESDSLGDSSTILDLSGLANNATLDLDVTSEKSVAGLIGRAVELDGSGDCITVPEVAADFGSADEFSISVWVAADPTSHGVIFAKDGGASHPFRLYFTSGQKFRFSAKGTSTIYVESTVAFTEHKWHHIAIVRDLNETIMYIDGRKHAQTTSVTGNSSNDEPLTIGCDSAVGNQSFLSSRIDELNLWARALTAVEVENIFFLQSPDHPGHFNSLIFDAGSQTSWQTVEWDVANPYSKPLLGNGVTETGYERGGLVMTANELLLPLDDSGTSLNDISPNALTNAQYDGSTNQVDGPSGKAIRLEGDSITLASHESFNFNNEDFSVAFWFRLAPKIQAGKRYLVHKSDLSTSPFSIYVNGGPNDRGRLFANRDDGSNASELGSQSPVDDGLWHHVALVKDASALNLYLDGLLENSAQDVATGTSANNASLVLGPDPNSTNTHNFDLDEFAIWSRAMNAGEVLSLYNRLAQQLQIQFRTCDDAACSGEVFLGPDASASTYFVDHPYSPQRDTAANISELSPNRYLQFRINMRATRLWERPVLRSLKTTPIIYPKGMSQILTNVSLAYLSLESFSIERQKSAKGSVFFQLSYDDGKTWVYYDGNEWKEAKGLSEYSSAETIDANIDSFNALGDTDKLLKIRILMAAAGVTSGSVTLDNIVIDYTPSAKSD